MGWRWRKSANLGGGARATMTARGVGVSWGFGGVRVGISPAGPLWVSFTIPGTGIGFFKYLSSGAPAPAAPPPIQNQPPAPVLPAQAPSGPTTANQKILAKIRRSKP